MSFYIFPLLSAEKVQVLSAFATSTCFARTDPVSIGGQLYDIFWPVDIMYVIERQPTPEMGEAGQFDVVLRVALAYATDSGVIYTPHEIIEKLHQIVQPAPPSLHSRVLTQESPRPMELADEAESAVRFAGLALARQPLAQPTLRAALRSRAMPPQASAA